MSKQPKNTNPFTNKPITPQNGDKLETAIKVAKVLGKATYKATLLTPHYTGKYAKYLANKGVEQTAKLIKTHRPHTPTTMTITVDSARFTFWGVIILALFLWFMFATISDAKPYDYKKAQLEIQHKASELREIQNKNSIEWDQVDSMVVIPRIEHIKAVQKEIDEANQIKKQKENDNRKLQQLLECEKEKWQYLETHKQPLPQGFCESKPVHATHIKAHPIVDLIHTVAQDKGIDPAHIIAISMHENRGMVEDLQARTPLIQIYNRQKSATIAQWCLDRKKTGEFPENWDCSKEQSVGLFQINLWVHRHISYKEAIDPKFQIEWTADRLLAKGYKKDKMRAIQAHNGFAKCHSRTVTCINDYDYTYANKVLITAKSI
jgi:hypothetical protein